MKIPLNLPFTKGRGSEVPKETLFLSTWGEESGREGVSPLEKGGLRAILFT